MKFEILPDAAAAAREAARLIAAAAREALMARGKSVIAVSGGHTPWQMLRDLTREDNPWKRLHVFQVNERIAPAEGPDRNLTHLKESLLSSVPLPQEQLHAMPVVLCKSRT